MKEQTQNNHEFFCNRECKYYPCHVMDNINCLFCFCPLYNLDCGGNFYILPNGIKDCSMCVIPHRAENYSYIIRKLTKGLKHGDEQKNAQTKLLVCKD